MYSQGVEIVKYDCKEYKKRKISDMCQTTNGWPLQMYHMWDAGVAAQVKKKRNKKVHIRDAGSMFSILP